MVHTKTDAARKRSSPSFRCESLCDNEIFKKSPSSSPSRKKTVIPNETGDNDDNGTNDDIEDIEVVGDDKDEGKKEKIDPAENIQAEEPFKITNHLKSVQNKLLTKLRCFKMRYCAILDEACLTNCTEDKEERKINN